jgi:hypothetical protein
MNTIEILTVLGIIVTSVCLGMIIGLKMAWSDANKIIDDLMKDRYKL